MKKEFLRSSLIMLITVVVFGLAAFGLNFITGPIIEENNAGAANELLENVMPGGKFEELYVDGGTNSLTDVPTEIKVEGTYGAGTSGKFISFYKETSGLGYVFRFSIQTSYSTNPMEYTVGVSTDGTISGIHQDVYTESKPLNDTFVSSFIGNDSTLANVELVTGVTYSSLAIKTAVEAGMKVLSTNGFITAGKKDDIQILKELVIKAHPNVDISKAKELSVSGNILEAYQDKSDSGFVYIVNGSNTKLLAVVNSSLVCKIYSYVEANNEYSLVDVTNSNNDLVTEVVTHATGNKTSLFDKFVNKISAVVGVDKTAITEVTHSEFNSINLVVTYEKDGITYYALSAKGLGYDSRNYMSMYVILDQNGAIVSVKPDTFIIDEEYFHLPPFEGVPVDYFTKFEGVTSNQLTDDMTIVTGATISSNFAKNTIKDAFATYNAIKNGGNN